MDVARPELQQGIECWRKCSPIRSLGSHRQLAVSIDRGLEMSAGNPHGEYNGIDESPRDSENGTNPERAHGAKGAQRGLYLGIQPYYQLLADCLLESRMYRNLETISFKVTCVCAIPFERLHPARNSGTRLRGRETRDTPRTNPEKWRHRYPTPNKLCNSVPAGESAAAYARP